MRVHKLLEDNINIKNRFFKFCFAKKIHLFVFLINSVYYFFKLLYQFILFINFSFRFYLSFFFNKKVSNDFVPLVSVIVPNYNHKKYLKKRLRSIYYQTYKNIEVILLDDCSNDGSTKILQKYANKFKNITKLFLNNKNSGGVFFQWKKGIELAKGDYIWIAESDDWCSLNFIQELVNSLTKHRSTIACANTLGVKNKRISWNIKQYCIGLDIDWNNDFFANSSELFNKGFGWRNIIPNVSSVIFKNTKDLNALLNDPDWQSMKLCGDWVFYLYLLKNDKLFSFVSSAFSYHRFHNSNTSIKIDNSFFWFIDHKNLSDYMASFYVIPPQVFINFKYNYLLHWKHFHSDLTGCPVNKIFENRLLFNDYTNLNALTIDYDKDDTSLVLPPIKFDLLIVYNKRFDSPTLDFPFINMADKGLLDVLTIFKCKNIFTLSGDLRKKIEQDLLVNNFLDHTNTINGNIYSIKTKL